MIKLSSITAHILDIWHRRNSRSYIAHLRSLGIRIGDGCIFRDPLTTRIDVSRPALVSIGSNVDMNTYFQIFIIRKSKFPPNPERSVLFSGKRTKRSVQKKGCTQHL